MDRVGGDKADATCLRGVLERMRLLLALDDALLPDWVPFFDGVQLG